MNQSCAFRYVGRCRFLGLALEGLAGAQERLLVAGAQSDLTPAVLAVPAEVVHTTSAKKPRGDKFCAEME